MNFHHHYVTGFQIINLNICSFTMKSMRYEIGWKYTRVFAMIRNLKDTKPNENQIH